MDGGWGRQNRKNDYLREMLENVIIIPEKCTNAMGAKEGNL